MVDVQPLPRSSKGKKWKSEYLRPSGEKNGVWERGEKRGAGGKAKAKMKAGEMK